MTALSGSTTIVPSASVTIWPSTGLAIDRSRVVERDQPAEPVGIDALLQRDVGLDVARDLAGEVLRRQPDEAHGVDRIVGGKLGDGRRVAGDVDVKRADHRRTGARS